jgi:hypothetical protein
MWQIGFFWVWFIVGIMEQFLHHNPYCCPCLTNEDFPIIVFPYSTPFGVHSLCLPAPFWFKLGRVATFPVPYIEIRGWICLPLFVSFLYSIGVQSVHSPINHVCSQIYNFDTATGTYDPGGKDVDFCTLWVPMLYTYCVHWNFLQGSVAFLQLSLLFWPRKKILIEKSLQHFRERLEHEENRFGGFSLLRRGTRFERFANDSAAMYYDPCQLVQRIIPDPIDMVFVKITTVKDINQLFSSSFVFFMTLGKIWSQNFGILAVTPAAPILKYCDMVHKQGRSTRKNRLSMGHSVQFATIGFVVGLGVGILCSFAILIGEYKVMWVSKDDSMLTLITYTFGGAAFFGVCGLLVGSGGVMGQILRPGSHWLGKCCAEPPAVFRDEWICGMLYVCCFVRCIGKGAHYTISRVGLSLWLAIWFAARINFMFWGFWLIYREGENSVGLQRNPGKCVDVYLFRESFMWWVIMASFGLLWLSQRPFHRPYLRASTKEVVSTLATRARARVGVCVCGLLIGSHLHDQMLNVLLIHPSIHRPQLFHEDSTAVSVKDSRKRGIHGGDGSGLAHGDEVSMDAYKSKATGLGLDQTVDTRLQSRCLRMWKSLNPTRRENKKFLRILYAFYLGLVLGMLFESRAEGKPCLSLRQIDECLELGLSNGQCQNCVCAPPAVYDKKTDGCINWAANQTLSRGTQCYRGFLPNEALSIGFGIGSIFAVIAIIAHFYAYQPLIDFLGGYTRKRMWKDFSVVPRLRSLPFPSLLQVSGLLMDSIDSLGQVTPTFAPSTASPHS